MTKYKYSRKEIGRRLTDAPYFLGWSKLLSDILAIAPTKQGKKVKEIKRLEWTEYDDASVDDVNIVIMAKRVNKVIDVVNHLLKNK